MTIREPVIYTRYSADCGARFEVVARRAGLFEVWVQAAQSDASCTGENWYVDVKDGAHFTDSLAGAIRIGEEFLKNMGKTMGSEPI